ncbi:hypothetical protein AV545_04515 [Paenibacillus jamilae]|uniref:hypothetical protein n=1 Tax=Paenibacillus jamilae TaxID=114136 RepID=UPI0007AB278D|nr:hypothetical protein [Paenibacillus jamilae]KZE65193.1 hypothetical protein AV545_04515 [Paenibacillus jamilae]
MNKDKDFKLVISSIILGGSFIIGSFINAHFSPDEKILKPQISQISACDSVLNKEEAAAYLKIPVAQLDNIIKRDDEQKKKLSVYDTYQFIPYANLDGHTVFLKDNLNNWLNFMTQKK